MKVSEMKLWVFHRRQLEPDVLRGQAEERGEAIRQNVELFVRNRYRHAFAQAHDVAGHRGKHSSRRWKAIDVRGSVGEMCRSGNDANYWRRSAVDVDEFPD